MFWKIWPNNFKEEFGPLKLQDIRPDHLNRYYAKLAEPGQNKRTGEPLSPKTIREHHRVISSILSLAVKEGLIPTNVAQRATPPKVPKHEMDVFEPEQVQAILQALEDEPMKWRVITTLLIATGARRGEIMGLRWENVDWDNKRLYLCENRVYTKASGTISTTLKTGENRYVSVPASVLELLRTWKAEQATNCNMLGHAVPAYIATHEDGKLMHPDGITDFLSKFSKRHSLPHIHPHKFRHPYVKPTTQNLRGFFKAELKNSLVRQNACCQGDVEQSGISELSFGSEVAPSSNLIDVV